MSHTPGLWKARKSGMYGEFGIFAADDEIASVNICDGYDEPKQFPAEANARLIAAAPDLLAALERAEPLLEITSRRRKEAGIEGPALDTVIAMARAAISKARGEGI